MRCISIRPRTAMIAAVLVFASASSVWAQSSSSDTVAGVVVDADGVLRKKTFDSNGQLAKERLAAAKAELGPKVSTYNKIRKISLNRLEAALAENNGVPTEEMKALAGLQRIHYVFLYPETKDVVVAGPAEGWTNDPAGRMVGVTTGRPVIQLQDLVAGLRAFAPGGKATDSIGCSIDPTQEGLAAMDKYLKTVSGEYALNNTDALVENMKTTQGMHQVSVRGVSPKTHFAQVMVEADYRMKLIGIGLEQPPVHMVSFIDKATASDGRRALQRWYFVPEYQCVRVSDDGKAMELVGDGVKLIGENEMISSDGRRQVSGKVGKASQAFTTSFTKSYSELAERSPIYAQLRNVIDVTIACAFMQKENYFAKIGWKLGLFGDEGKFAIETYSAPKTVEPAVNAVFKNGTLMTPIGGGVDIQAAKALENGKTLTDEKGKVSKVREEVKINLAAGQWWWD